MKLSGGKNRSLRRVAASALIVVGMLPVALDGGLRGNVVDAELIDAFTPPAFTTNTTGAIDIIGNGLLTCGTSTNCQQTLAGTRNSGNGSFTMIEQDLDDGVLPATAANQTTGSSSPSNLSLPAGSSVLYAALYWSAESNSANRNRIDFLAPGQTNYTSITGSVDSAGSLYQARADVTALVQASGSGDYWVGDIQTSTGRNDYAGWSLAVVYENPALPVRNLSVFEGFGRVRNRTGDQTLDVPISGFLTPPFGNVNAEVGVVAYEGDRNINNDLVRIDSNGGSVNNGLVTLSDASNPNNNFGNGSISDAGVPTGANGVINNLNVDIDEFATVNTLSNAQTDTTVRFQTQGDWWYPGALTFAVDLFVPEFPEITKTVVDRNGGEALPGDILDYAVTFTNTGNDGAIDSIVRDPIPDDTTFLPGSISVANGVGSLVGNEIVAPVGDGPTTPASGGFLEPGEVTVIEFSVTIDESARGTDIENTATMNYTAQTLGDDFTFTTNETVTPVPPLARLSVTKSATPDPVASGENVTSTIVVTNAGPNPATGVTLQDSLTNSTFVSATGATCSGTTTIDCVLADLAVGASATVTIVASTDAALPAGSSVSNTASVDADEDDDELLDNSATAQVQAQPEADLEITKADDIDPARPGDTIIYTVSVTNNGPSVAHDVAIADSPQGGLTVTSVSAPGATCDQGARQCVLPLLAVGGSVDMTVEATVADSATGTVTNLATVQSADVDPVGGNNDASEDTIIEALADVTVSKDTDPSGGTLVAGTRATYVVTVSNAGPSTATDVEVVDTLPAGVVLVSASTAQGSCAGAGPVTCTIGTIPNGGSIDVTVVVDIDDDANGASLTNTATVSTATDEPAGGGATNTASTTDIVANSSDLRQQKTVSQNPIVAGTSFSYTLSTFNDGPSDTAGDITITDTVPDDVVIDSVSPGCTVAGQIVTCTSAASLAVGASPLVFTIDASVPAGGAAPTAQNTVTATYAGTDPNTANNTAVAETTFVNEADVLIDKEWSAATVTAGSTATFTLEVTNEGPSLAQDVSVLDSLPGGATVVSAGTPGVTCGGTGTSSLACTVDADMAVNDVITITVVAAIPADADAGLLNNGASVASTTLDRNPSNNSDVDGITVERTADLSITKVATDDTPTAGETVDYTITVTNAGPSTARDAVVGDAPPAGLTLVGTPTAAPSGTCANNAGAISCDLGTVQTTDTITITYSATVDAALAPGTVLTNTATAATSDNDPTPATVDETVTVATEADLVVAKSASIDPATPGAPLTYTLTVENAGPSDARDVELNDPLPAGFTATSMNSTVGSCTLAGLCTLGTLSAGATATITVVGEVDAGVTAASLTNTTDAVTASTPLINTGDDTGSVTVGLAPSAAISISKTSSVSTIDAGGGQVTFTIAVANAGPSDAENVDVTDTLPAGFVVDATTPSQGGCATDTSCQLGTVTAGSNASIVVVGYFPNSAAAGTVTNTAAATTSTPTPTPGPLTDSVDVDVTTSADVSVSKSGPLSTVAGGTGVDGVGYTISVGNSGPSVATDVVLNDVLDATLLDAANATITVAPSGACTPTNSAGSIGCDIGTLAVGGLVTVSISADVLPSAPAGTDNLVNTAIVAASTDDPEASNDSSTVETDVTINSDLSIVKVDPAQFRAGESADYTITVTNNGPSDATGVEVADVPAAILTFGAVTSTPNVCGALPCVVGDLAAGDSVVITVPATVDDNVNNTVVANTATVTSTSPDFTSGNNSSTVSTGIVRRADMELVSKESSPDPVSAGEPIEYTIVAQNAGPAVARDATIVDTVPVGTTLLPATLPTGCTSTGNAAGDTITCELGDLSAGDSVTRVFSVIVNPDVVDGTTISNTATADSDTIDDVPGNNEQTEPTAVAAVADVGITKNVSPDPIVPGSPATYTITVTNAGPSVATGVEVTDDVSAIFDGGVATSAVGTGLTCDLTVSCDPFDLPVGSIEITVTGTVIADQTIDVSNVVTVTSTSTDDNPANDSFTLDSTVEAAADLVITKVDDVVTTIDPTGTITYTVEVTNNGPSDAQNVSINDAVPAEVTVTGISSTPAGCTALPCDFGTLADGATATVTIVGTISDRAVGTITNSAAVTSDTPDPAPGDETVSLVTNITSVADIGITKSLLTVPLVAGRPARYEIVVTNNGPAIAENVELAETLPAGVAFTAISSPIGTCDAAPVGGVVSCDLGDLNDQASVTILVDVLVDAATTANLVNSAATTTDTQEPTGAGALPNTATTDSAVVVAPDLRVEKTLTDDDLVAGDPYEYTVTVVNDGPSVASGTMTLTDQLPSQILPAAGSVTIGGTNGGDCTYQESGGAQPRLISCTFTDDIAVGSSLSFTINGTIDAGVTTVDDNTATVSTTDDDPDLGNNSGTAQATLTTNADLIATKTFDDSSVIAGETTTFTMSVQNSGPSVAANAQLFDRFPVGVSIVSFTPTPAGATCASAPVNGQEEVTCTGATLAPGATLSVDVEIAFAPDYVAGPYSNTAVASSDTADRNPSNNSGVDDIEVTREAALSITKTPDIASVLAGNTITYTIGYRNDGPSSAEASVIGDALPPGTSFQLPLPAGCTESAGILDCQLGDLAPMAPSDPNLTFTYTVVVDPDVANATDIVNVANISSITPPAGGVPPTPGTAVVPVGTSADVELVSKTVTPDPVLAGENVTYTITVQNNGPSISRNTTIDDDLPDTLTLVAPLPAGCSDVAGDLQCNLGTLTVGQQESFTFVATVGSDTDPEGVGSVITNNASVSSDEPDPDNTNDSGTATTNVDAEADITITKAATPDPAIPGQPISYEITVTNAGPSEARDVVVDDVAPVELSGVSATADDGSTCTSAVSCDLGVLDVGEAVTITVDATVSSTVTAPIDNSAMVTSSTPPSASGPPRTVTISTPVAPVADLAITKALAPAPPVPGAPVAYTIVVTNPGPSASQNVVVTDTLDAAITNIASATAGCVVTDQDIECTFATLAPGTQTIVVTGDLDEAFTGDLANTASVTTDTPEGPNTSPNSAAVSETAAPEADVQIVKTAAPDPVVAGEALTYTLVVTNNGPSTATDVSVIDDVPAGFDLIDVTSTPTGCLSAETGSPCVIPTLAVGATETITISGAVNADVTDLPANVADVTAATTDSTPGNNSSTADPVVNESASVTTTKVLTTPASGIVVPGEPVEWEISVVNNGPSDAVNVEVDDAVPAILTNVVIGSTATPAGPATCTAFPCTLGTIEPAGAVVITVTADVPSNITAGDLVNSAATSSDTPDPDPTDNNPTATNPIVPSADVSISKSGPATLTPGTDATYVITVTNNGPSDADDISVLDTLPAALDPTTITEVSPTADCAITGLDLACTQTLLEDQATSVVTVTGTVLSGFTGGTVDNTATVTAVTPDPDPSPASNSSTTTATVVPEADLSITKSLTSAPPVPGESVAYEIVVTNGGPSAAQAVVVTDTVNAAVTNLATSTPNCAFSGQDLTCNLGALEPGSTTITFTGDLDEAFTGNLSNTANVASTTPEVIGSAPNFATSVEPAEPAADLELIKTASPDPVTAGETVTYLVTVNNLGPSTAAGVEVSDILPAGFTLAAVDGITSSQGGCTAVPCDLGAIADQGTATVTIVGTIDADITDIDPNLASVTSDTPDSDTTNNGDDADPVIETRAEISVTKTAAPVVLVPGQPVQYTITVTNAGPSDALATEVTDTVPTELTSVVITSSQGGCGAFPCDLGTVDAGTSETVTVTALVPSDVTATSITNSATATSTTTDTTPGDNTGTTTNAVEPEADLVTTKSGPTTDAVPGETVTYTITVDNDGPSDAFAVTIDDDLDAAFDPVGVTATSATGATCVVTGLAVDCTQATLAAGDSTTVEITATVLASFTGAAIDNTAVAGSNTPDATPGDNTSTISTPSAASADLSITKVDDVVTQLNPSDPIEYTITVSNAGPSDAQAVEVADAIPAILNNVVISSVPVGCTAFPCTLGTVAAGADVVITVTADADADALDEIVNTASVTSTTPDPSPGDESATETTSITPYADLGVAKALVLPVGGVVAGVPARYELTITNDGPAVAVGAVLTDTLPAGTTFVSASTPVGSCAESAGELTCDFGDLPDGASVTVLVNVDVAANRTADLVNTASVESPTIFDPNAANDAVTVTSPVEVQADLQVAKTLRDAPIVAGTPFFYDVTITNNGPSTSVEDIVFTDTLPSEVDLTTVDAGLPTECSRVGADVTCTFTPDLVATDTITFTISGETLSGVANISPNNAEVATVDDPAVNQTDPEPTNNSTQATGAVNTEADLVLTKVFADDATIAGDGTIEFTLEVTSNGPSDALAVVITDVLPAGLTVSGTPTPTFSDASTGTCAVATTPGIDTLTCDIDGPDGRLIDGATMTVVVTAAVDPNQPAGPLTNSAEVASTTTDRSPANNTSSDSIIVSREAELNVGKVANPTNQNAGLDVAYTVTVENLGPSTAEATVLGDALPAGMTIQPASIVITGAPTGAACTLPGGILTCDLGLLPAPSGVITVDYTVSIDADLDPSITSLVNAATITSATPPAGGTPTPPAAATVDLDTEADLELVSKTASPTTVVAGENTTYTVIIRNNGPSTARNVVIDDTIPAGITVTSQSAGCTYTPPADVTSTSALSCDLGDVDPATGPADTVTITYEVTVDESVTASPLTNSATVSSDTAEPAVDPSPNTITEDITIVTEADLSIAKSAAPTTAVPGETLTYTIVVTNDGPSTARDVVVTDDITGIFEATPAVTVTPGGGTTCTDAVACDPFDLPVGSTTFTISGTVLRTTTAAIGNTASVTSATPQPVGDPLVETATISTPVAPTADLAVAKTIVTDPVVPGSAVTFEIVVDNPGPSAAQAVMVDDSFDAALSAITIDSVVGADIAGCGVTGQDLNCDFGVVDAGTITITVTADLAAAYTGDLDNTATVSTTTDEGLNTSPNSSTASAPTVPTADVSLAKIGTPVVAGEDVTYTVTATNLGPSTATGVTVSDTLPAGLTLVSVSSSQGGCTALPCNLGSLPLNGSADVTIVATLDPAATTLATNTAQVTTSSFDPNDGPTSNNFASATPPVTTEARLTTTKVQTVSPAVPGEPVEWTIVVANAGPSDALDVDVADALPAAVVNPVFSAPGATCTATGCALGTIAAGAQQTITVTADLPADVAPGQLVNTATTTSSTPIGPGSVLVATSDEPIVPSADVQIVKTAAPEPLVPGDEVTYTLTVTNNGPSDAQGVNVVDQLPTAIDLSQPVVVVAPDASCTRTGRDIECDIATLADAAIVSIAITATVDDGVLADVTNAAQMTTTTADPTPGNDNSSVTSTVEPEADIGLVKVFVTDPIVPGSLVEFEITVTNNGPSAAQDVVVTDTLPAEYTAVASSTPGCVVAGNEITCDLGEVAPGAQFINVSGLLASGHVGATSNAASLTTSTTQTGALPDTATVAGTATPEADLAVEKTATPDPVTAGEDVTYVITVDNFGPSDSLDVTVDDVLPAGLTLVSVTPSQGTCSSLPCNLGTIVDEADATVTVVATVDSSTLTLAANSASANSPTTVDSTPANNTDTATPTVETRADLVTTKALSTPTAVPGEPLRWTITVVNPGPSDALNVEVADTVTSDVDSVAIASSQGGCVAFPCNLGIIAAGDQATITIDADLPASVVANTIENQATTTSDTPDGNPLDNSPIASNPIAPAADLRIAKVGPTTDVVAGTAVQWTITVDNDGPSDSRDVVIADDLPAAVDPATVVVSSPSATCAVTGLAVECTQDVVADGETVTITIDAVLRSDFVGSLDNTATVTSLSTTDLDPSDNSATSNSTNVPLADISITGAATPTSVVAGSDVGFEFVITNTGPSNAADTVVTIPLPASITLIGSPTLVGAPPGATVSVVDGEIVVDLGSLPPGTPVTISFDGTVTSDQPAGNLDIPARSTTTTNQTTLDDDDTVVTLDIITDVDLSIAKTSDVQQVRFGDDIVFTVTVTNDGISTSNDATIVDELPDSLAVVSVTDPGDVCVIATNTVTCANPTIAPNGGTYAVVITATAIGNGADENVASVAVAGGAEITASNPAGFVIERVSDLSISKTVDRASVQEGERVVYSIVVRNDGPDDALGVRVNDQLPAGLVFVSAIPSAGTYDQAGGLWSIGDLANGATATLVITVQVVSTGTITNVASVESDVTDPSTGNDDSATVRVVASVIPATGSDSPSSLPIGFGLIGVGFGLLLLARRRRGDHPMPSRA